MKLRTDEIDTGIGTILIATDDASLCALDFADTRRRMLSGLRSRYGEVDLERYEDPLGCASRVRAYLAGELDALDDVTVDTGGTPFQRRVFAALRRIPCGSTISYGALASAIGAPRAARAVGAANARNPVAIAVPCHRVIGTSGALTGYAGGLARKRWLLAHEVRATQSLLT